MAAQVIHGDCMDVLAGMGDGTVDSIVTDPPYEIGFMGKGWDGSGIAYRVELWAECLRVLKPGGHLLAFGGTRTYHRMACAIEDAGFEVRDSLHWIYGSGFPKSLDVSKAIDKAAGTEGGRGAMKRGGQRLLNQTENGARDGGGTWGDEVGRSAYTYAPATDAARQWAGYGTALKPAHEPIVVARKPLTGTVAANVLAHGTGALNIDGSRVGYASDTDRSAMSAGVESIRERGGVVEGSWKNSSDLAGANPAHTAGRWPANLVLTHAADCADRCADGCPVAELDGQGDGASRFFTVTEWDPTADVPPFRYVSKPSKRERNAGLDGLPEREWREGAKNSTPRSGQIYEHNGRIGAARANHHPTVKAVALMRWLVRLVTPPGGTVLDPFAGSGTTLVAATLEGFDSIGIEMTDDYLPIIAGRVEWAENEAAAPPDTLFDPRTAAT